MEKSQRIETQLPEPMIQHIQSYLDGKEAAQTAVLSKSWYAAWLTRPVLVFDLRDFQHYDPAAIEELASEAFRRYQSLNLNIESFKLWAATARNGDFRALAGKLAVDAVKLGATSLDLDLHSPASLLPQEVLNSKTLSRLSVKRFRIDGSVGCHMLKSLRLEEVIVLNDGMIRDLVSRCVSIEELSLSKIRDSSSKKLALRGEDVCELSKLKRLHLEMLDVDCSFFDNFGSRFPCLNDLSIVHCHGFKRIHISSISLQRVSLLQSCTLRADLDVPNLAYFNYSGKSVPCITIEALEWESSISIRCNRFHTYQWYVKLLKLLNQLSPSRITMSLNFAFNLRWNTIDDEKDFKLPSRPVAVENLTIEAPLSYSHNKFLPGLFWICHPKFLTLYWLPEDSCEHWQQNNESLNHVRYHLSPEVIKTYDRGNSMFGRFDIVDARMEVYEEDLTEWRPLLLNEPLDAVIASPNKREVRFGLKWKP